MTTKQEKERVFATFPIRVAMGPGDNPVYTTVAEAATFAIARYAAYTIAMRGVPTKWPKRENTQNADNAWFTSSVEKARNLSGAHSGSVAQEATYDRAQIAGREMRSRSRLGNVLGDIQGVAESTSNPVVRHAVNAATAALAEALLQPIVANAITDYGVQWAHNAKETLDAAAAAWGVEPFAGTVCSAGVAHDCHERNAPEIDLEALLRDLESAMAEATAPEAVA